MPARGPTKITLWFANACLIPTCAEDAVRITLLIPHSRHGPSLRRRPQLHHALMASYVVNLGEYVALSCGVVGIVE